MGRPVRASCESTRGRTRPRLRQRREGRQQSRSMNTTASLLAASRTMDIPAPVEAPEMSWKRAILLAGTAAGSFHLAYAFPPLSFLIVIYLYGLVQLSG